MIGKPISEIEYLDLQALIGRESERKTLEFKSAMPAAGNADSEIVPFLANISAMANTDGGDFIIGVGATAEGVAESVEGVECNPDDEKLRLEQVISTLRPRLPITPSILPVPCPGGRYALVIRVQRSWIGPHRVEKNHQFYGRNSAGKYPLDVDELRRAFVLTESVAERMYAFRADRMIRIMADETPVPLGPRGKLVLHLVPLSFFANRERLDASACIAEAENWLKPPGAEGMQLSAYPNLDGVYTRTGDQAEFHASYAQLFRSGAVEGVRNLGVDEQTKNPFVNGVGLDRQILVALEWYRRLFKNLQIQLPAYAFISFCKMSGATLRYPTHHGATGFHVSGPIKREAIAVPEVVLDSPTADLSQLIEPAFEITWNAFGVSRRTA